VLPNPVDRDGARIGAGIQPQNLRISLFLERDIAGMSDDKDRGLDAISFALGRNTEGLTSLNRVL